jgi:hypothetical protein
MPQAIVRFRAFGTLSGSVSSYVLKRFAEGSPSIFSVAAGEDGVFINPMTLRDDEFEAIIRRVEEIAKETDV